MLFAISLRYLNYGNTSTKELRYLLSLYINKPSPSSKELDITIKVNVVDLSGIIQTFARYDYLIKATYMDQSQIKNLFDDRYDQFMRYLNV